MKYNKSEIMKQAHMMLRGSKLAYADRAAYNAKALKRGYITEEMAQRSLPKLMTLSEALKVAWKMAKARANTTDEERLFQYEMIDRPTAADREAMRVLYQKIQAKKAA